MSISVFVSLEVLFNRVKEDDGWLWMKVFSIFLGFVFFLFLHSNFWDYFLLYGAWKIWQKHGGKGENSREVNWLANKCIIIHCNEMIMEIKYFVEIL